LKLPGRDLKRAEKEEGPEAEGEELVIFLMVWIANFL